MDKAVVLSSGYEEEALHPKVIMALANTRK